MSEPVCIVTGATSGIGRATALGLARRGASVGIVARDAGKARATADEIVRGGGAMPMIFLADLGSQAEVRRVAREILDRCPRVDVLVNNAGVVNLRRETTVDGHESVFAVNHLAYWSLTLLLLDRLRESAPSRVVNVSSDAHKIVDGISFEDPGFDRGWSTMKVYGHSKLANILFTRELARRIEGSGVTVNCLHPGAVATGLGKNNGRIARGLIALLKPFFRTPESGAETSIHLAASPEVAGRSGGYWARCRERSPSAAALDAGAARRLWDLSASLTGIGLDEDGRVVA
ncbi:MAG: SDR family NAD(P)-dependent oxidoreductase [Alphaproteobacteria bacterium]